MTFAQLLRPAQRAQALAYDVTLIVGGSILIALSAQVVLPLPFSPVPVTGQTFAVLFLGALLGRWRGASAALAYVSEGATGLPVFAGGAGGFFHLIGPTGGYLIGFVVAAYVVGALSERGWNRHVHRVAAAMVVGNAIVYLFGAAWLAHFVGVSRAFALGVAPFLVGDAFKIVLAALVLPPATACMVRRQNG